MYRSLDSHLSTPGIDLISLVPGPHLPCRAARPLRLTPDNSNLSLTRTKIAFPWISFIRLL